MQRFKQFELPTEVKEKKCRLLNKGVKQIHLPFLDMYVEERDSEF